MGARASAEPFDPPPRPINIEWVGDLGVREFKHQSPKQRPNRRLDADVVATFDGIRPFRDGGGMDLARDETAQQTRRVAGGQSDKLLIAVPAEDSEAFQD
jgi:hypothetical protein